MATGIYNSYKANVFSPADIELLANDIKVALMAPGYAPDFDTEQFYSDVSGQEAAGVGYTPGGQSLTTKTVSQDNVNDRGVFDGDDIQWPGSTITARGALVYKNTGNPSTSKLIGFIDFGTNRSSSGGTFTIQWQSVGIVLAS